MGSLVAFHRVAFPPLPSHINLVSAFLDKLISRFAHSFKIWKTPMRGSSLEHPCSLLGPLALPPDGQLSVELAPCYFSPCQKNPHLFLPLRSYSSPLPLKLSPFHVREHQFQSSLRTRLFSERFSGIPSSVVPQSMIALSVFSEQLCPRHDLVTDRDICDLRST